MSVIEDDVLKKYLEAGRIAARVREEASKLVKPGAKLLDVCEKAEQMIREHGALPAFPCNISVNHIAAHYTPLIGDEGVVPENAVVKIDVGVHIDGYIADTATTVALDDRYLPLLEAVREALDRAIEAVKPGVKFSEIGGIIEKTMKKHGYRPIANLSGHSIARYSLHAGESIPNIKPLVGLGLGSFKPGRVYAIEPFGTNGEGYVVEGKLVTIYSLKRTAMARRSLTGFQRKLVGAISNRFKTLPFTERWLRDLGSPESIRKELRRLARRGVLIDYPVLVERGQGIVAQFEHTVIVLKDGVIVTTRA